MYVLCVKAKKKKKRQQIVCTVRVCVTEKNRCGSEKVFETKGGKCVTGVFKQNDTKFEELCFHAFDLMHIQWGQCVACCKQRC